MVLIRHYDLITRAQQRTKSLRQNIKIQGGRWPDGDFIGFSIDKFSDRRIGLIHLFACSLRQRIGGIRLNFMRHKKAAEPIDHGLGDIGTPGVFKEDPVPCAFGLKSRKL